MNTTTANSFLTQSILSKTDEQSSTRANVWATALVTSCLLFHTVGNIPTSPVKDYSTYSYYNETSQYAKLDAEVSIVDVISGYQNYPVNWDGYDGVPPTAETVKDVSLFIEQLPQYAVKPRPGLSGDGAISLFWESDNVFVDIGFIGDGKYAFYAKDTQSVEYYGDDVDLSGAIPDALLSLIKKKS